MTATTKTLTRDILKAFETGDTAFLETYVGPDFVQHSPGMPSSREALFKFHNVFHQAFPNGRFDVDDMIGEDDKVLIRWTMRGTQTGPWFGVPATGRTVEFVGMDLWRYADGKLVEAWFVGDNMTLMRQLGLLPGQRERAA